MLLNRFIWPLAVASRYGIQPRRGSRTEAIYGALREGVHDAGLLMGIFFLASAAALAAQTYYTRRQGYVYSGVVSRVQQDENPRAYRFWTYFQCSMIGFLAAAGGVFILFP